jgi:hypothetical protein
MNSSSAQPALTRAVPKLAKTALLVAVAVGVLRLVVAGGMSETPSSSSSSPSQRMEPEQVKIVLQVPSEEAPQLRVQEEPTRSSQGTAAPLTWVSSVEATAPQQAREPRSALQQNGLAVPPQTLSAGGLRLRLPHEGRGADGLPTNSVRCTSDGGVVRCGECQSDSDCPAGKGCVANGQTHRLECMASDCEQDLDCFPGLVCRPATLGNTGPVVHRCVAAGERSAGESCDLLFVSKAGACQEGLICHRGVCSTPCSMEDASSCPEGSSCEEGLNGAACFGDCRVQGCAQGQQCKRLSDTKYQCLESVRGECPETPCAQGQRCNARVSHGQGVFWCAQLCNPLLADSCSTGQVCGVGAPTVSTCFRRCDPGAVPDTCGEGWQCVSVSEDMTQFGCRPLAQPERESSISSVAP